MQNEPLISIAMATYNGERFVSKQIESLLNQSYSNLEIIISDDNSTDSTYEICEKYAEKDTRIKLVKNKRSKGFISNFQNALSFCSGIYIVLADQDDLWYKEKVIELFNEIYENDLIYSDAKLIDDCDNTIAESYSIVTEKFIPPRNVVDIILNNPVTGCTLMFNASLLDKVIPFPQGIPAHDQWITLAAFLSNGIKYIDKPLIGYRQHSTNQIGANINDKSILTRIKDVISKSKRSDFLVQEKKQLSLINEMLSRDSLQCLMNNKDRTELLALRKYYNNFLNKCSFFSILWFRIKKHDAFTPGKSVKVKLVGVVSIFKVLMYRKPS